ncbi:precorrin-3B synthase [Devosia sp.]|uniref:precorrin-3B synthase n=1 Tax=Devosia sp. TaxID=1871048 RepID=UPI002FC888E4
MSLALPLEPSRRGACPSLDMPMQTGDGLLARIRIAGGQLDPVRLEQLAVLGGTYGNGVIEITARGNLQVRGLTAALAPAFASAVRQVIDVETGLVVETPPLAGDDPLEFIDPRPLAASIKALAAPFAHRLGPKVAVIVDGNGQIGLGALKADLRLVAVGPDIWLVSVGATLLGTTRRPLDCAGVVLTALASLGLQGRATDLPLADLAPELDDLVSSSAPVRQPVSSPIGRFPMHRGKATGLGLPFGAMACESIAALADGAWRSGISAFRPGPHHSLIAIGGDGSLIEEASQIGFITHPNDPRTRISACIGSDGCASGHIAARAVASRLAPSLAPGSNLHVSGCQKGCAHPGRAEVTLIGRADGYGLVIDGRAGDTPRAVLRADQLETALLAAQG